MKLCHGNKIPTNAATAVFNSDVNAKFNTNKINNKNICLISDNRSKCRGFGYVQFVVQEDADKAVTTPKTVNNRTLKIVYADKKSKHEKRKKGLSISYFTYNMCEID